MRYFDVQVGSESVQTVGPVHTNHGRSLKDMIGVVMNPLVGRGLYAQCCWAYSNDLSSLTFWT